MQNRTLNLNPFCNNKSYQKPANVTPLKMSVTSLHEGDLSKCYFQCVLGFEEEHLFLPNEVLKDFLKKDFLKLTKKDSKSFMEFVCFLRM